MGIVSKERSCFPTLLGSFASSAFFEGHPACWWPVVLQYSQNCKGLLARHLILKSSFVSVHLRVREFSGIDSWFAMPRRNRLSYDRHAVTL